MGKVVYNAEVMKVMSLFEQVTAAVLKDCILLPNQVIFVVKEGMMSKAIGKKGQNVKTLQEKLNRKIKIVEFNSKVDKFVKSFLLPVKVDEVEVEDGVVKIKTADVATKSMLIGRNGQKLRETESYIQRLFPNLKEIKVI